MWNRVNTVGVFLVHVAFDPTVLKCIIKIFMGGRGSSERCLKWPGGVIKGSFQKHLKTGDG